MPKIPFRRFVPREELRFSIEELLEECFRPWRGRLLPEGLEDLVVAELDRCGLRELPPNGEALFNRVKGREEYRQCILSCVRRLADDMSRPLSPEDLENYRRPCGE